MLARLLLLSLLSLTLTGQGQASMGDSWVGPQRYMQAYRFMPGKWPGNMPRITPMDRNSKRSMPVKLSGIMSTNIPLHRNIIGRMAGNFLENILGVIPSNSLPGILRWKTQKSILGNVPEEGDSM
jgi:hypothetical protein